MLSEGLEEALTCLCAPKGEKTLGHFHHNLGVQVMGYGYGYDIPARLDLVLSQNGQRSTQSLLTENFSPVFD